MAPQSSDFLQAFSTDRRFALALPELWTVSIGGVSVGDINSVLQWAGEKWRAKLSPNSMTRNGNVLPAQSVSLPVEQTDIQSHVVGDGLGGFMPSHGLNSRTPFISRVFSVNFLETESDLEHDFFRPWTIAIGMRGLVNHGGISLKGNLIVRQYTNQGVFRKGFQFENVIPTACEGYTLDYESGKPFLVKSVTFSCQNYHQL